MVGGEAVLEDAAAVLECGVARIVIPTIVWVLLVKGVHVVVTIGLCQDRGGSDGEIFAIALDDGLMGQITIGLEAVAIDDDKLWANLELVEGTMHSEDGCVEDIYLVDLLGCDHPNCPC